MATTTPCRLVQVPGPQGIPGTSPADPTDGIDAFSLIDGGAVAIPSYGDQATITLKDPAGSRWMSTVQIVYVQGVGYFQVLALPSDNEATILNVGYPGNIDGAGFFADSLKVSPAGLQGSAGSTPADALLAANNLSDLTNVANARTNLGLGALGVLNTVNDGNWSGTALALANGGTGATTAATARTNLGLGSIATQSASSVAITGGTISGLASPLAIADGGTGATTAAGIRSALSVLPGYGILGIVTSWNLNAGTNDTSFTVASARYIIDRIEVDNASANLTVATGGLFTAAGGGGTTIAADQALSALTAASKYLNLSLQSITDTDVFTAGTLYARCGTAQGGAATATLRVFGWKLD